MINIELGPIDTQLGPIASWLCVILGILSFLMLMYLLLDKIVKALPIKPTHEQEIAARLIESAGHHLDSLSDEESTRALPHLQILKYLLSQGMCLEYYYGHQRKGVMIPPPPKLDELNLFPKEVQGLPYPQTMQTTEVVNN